MRPGQPVTLSIDAYPDRVIRGHVASIQPGSGTAFSLLPAENATGNYVKIVQRVPVKIIMDNPPADVALGPGMSVVPTVRVDPAPSLYERLAGALMSAMPRPQPAALDPASRAAGANPWLIAVVVALRDLHGGSRHHHRQCRAALHRRRPGASARTRRPGW